MNTQSHKHHSSVTRIGSGYSEEPSDNLAGGFSRLFFRLGLPLGLSAASGLIFSAAAALAATATTDPTAWILPLSAVALFLSALVGGITAGKCNPQNVMGSAAISGSIFAVILIFLSLFGGDMGWLSWVMRLSPIPVHILGGALSRPRAKPAKHTTPRHPAHH